jgi:hypothetical protein
MHANKTITLDVNMFNDLMRIKEEFDRTMESIELMADREFMESYQKAKQEIKNKDFEDWSELTNGL